MSSKKNAYKLPDLEEDEHDQDEDDYEEDFDEEDEDVEEFKKTA